MATAPPTVFTESAHPTETATAEAPDDAMAALLASLESEDPKVRKAAVEKLTWRDDATPALPKLRKALKDADPVVRAAAARAVWQIDRTADEAVPVLVKLLESDNTNHRELAAYFLGPMAEAAKPAIPALREALQDEDTVMQIHAAEALAQIAPKETEAVDVLVQVMENADPTVRSLAAMAFTNVDPVHADRVVPVLMTAVVDADTSVRTAAELALPTFNVHVAHSGQDLLPEPPAAMMTQETPAEEVSVSPTAENTTPFDSPEESSESFPELTGELARAVRDLSHENPAIRRAALDRIAWMGPEAEAAIPEVVACLGDPHPGIQAYAAKTLWDLDKQSGLAAVNTLRDLVDSTQPGIRPLAAFYLGYIGPEAASTLPVLKRALRNTEYTEQLQIAEAVARINPEDPDAVNVLIGGLRDPESGVRFQAAYALSAVSPIHAERVVPELATATQDQDPRVGQAAELALANFAPAPSEIEVAQAENRGTPESEMASIKPANAESNESAAPPVEPELAFEPSNEEPIEEPASEAMQIVQLDPQPVAPVPTEQAGEYRVIPAEGGEAPPLPENRLGLGEDYVPITAVNITISPKRRDAEGNLLALPTNYGAAWLRSQGRHHHPRGVSRPWTVQAKQYAASGFCHRPLYFEEVNLERYGHNFGCVMQPFVSAGAFFGRVPLLPYMMAADCPCECQYTLGHYRPGNCVPFQHMRLPWSTSGALLQAGIVTGLFFAIY